MRDERGRFVKATVTAPAKEQFSIDEAARQLARDCIKRDLAESATELAKAATVTLGGFPESPHKGSSSKAPAAAPVDDPDSSSSSDTDYMSDHGEGAGGPAPIPAPVPDSLPQLSIKVPSPKKFTGEGEDLKPEAFERWYNSVQLYLRLHKVPQNADGAGNYWILYTEGRAQEAAFQAAELFGEDITRDLLITCLRERFQSSKFKNDTYQKFHSIRQQWNGQVQKIFIIATDLLMHRSWLPEDNISDYAFIQQFFTSMHPRLRQDVEVQYTGEEDINTVIATAERIDSIQQSTGAYGKTI